MRSDPAPRGLLGLQAAIPVRFTARMWLMLQRGACGADATPQGTKCGRRRRRGEFEERATSSKAQAVLEAFTLKQHTSKDVLAICLAGHDNVMQPAQRVRCCSHAFSWSCELAPLATARNGMFTRCPPAEEQTSEACTQKGVGCSAASRGELAA